VRTNSTPCDAENADATGTRTGTDPSECSPEREEASLSTGPGSRRKKKMAAGWIEQPT
jgi:hypothetical protein